MLKSLRWALPLAAVLALVVMVSAKVARADDAAGAALTGKVVDDAGAPVADAKVELSTPRVQGGDAPKVLGTATSDKDGKFSIVLDKAKVPDGKYTVRTRSGDKGARADVTVKDGKPDPADVTLKLKTRPARPAN